MNTINTAVAREHGDYASILYTYLQDKQREHNNYSDVFNTRIGLKWIVSLTYQDILNALPCFPDVKTVKRAAHTLRAAGLILMETTGRFLEKDHVTGRKRDIAAWWHVSRQHVANKAIPAAYFDKTQRVVFDAEEAKRFGIPQALILAYWRASKQMMDGYSKLSAVELERVLPMDERTARRHLKAMVKGGLLFRHPQQKKLYILYSEYGKAAGQPKLRWRDLQPRASVVAAENVVEGPVFAQEAA